MMEEAEKDIIDVVAEQHAEPLGQEPMPAEQPKSAEQRRKHAKRRHLPRKMRFRPHLWRLKILDRYILKKFLGTYFVATLLVLAVIAMFDVTEKLDAFLTAPVKETILDYFSSFLPYFAVQLSPLFVFIAVIFFTSKMAGNSEIIAILSSGVSYRRLLVPYMIGAAVIAGLTFWLSNYAIPPSNVKRLAYTNKYVKNKKETSASNVQLQVQPGKKLVSRLTAQTVQYDSLRQHHWILHDYMIRTLNGQREKIIRGASLDTVIDMEPQDFLVSTHDQETYTTPELTTYIAKQKNRGSANVVAFEIEKEKRYAMTAAAFILTLIGMALSSRKVKGGMGLNIGIGLALSFSYILFSTVTSSFAISGATSARVAMWIPNIVYLAIGIVLYYRAAR